jgi:YfiH family protein
MRREAPVGDPAVPRLELDEWAARYGLVAGITTRPLDLGLWSDAPVGQVLGLWRAFRTAFAGRFPSVVSSYQVHGREVRWYDAGTAGWLVSDALDGHATRQAGVLLAVTVADCVPVYLAAPAAGAVALLHAGWRGTAARIVQRGLELLAEAAGVAPADVIMHCGVGICGECYEVGAEVVAELGGGASAPGAGSAHVDLRALLVRQARDLGVTDATVSPWCSAHDRERFFSHRASGGRDGRMLAYLGRPAASA